MVIHEQTGVRSHEVNVYGVDDRFWKFHGVDVPAFPDDRAAYVGDSLARQLNIKQEDALLLRVEIPQAIPREWLYGRRDDGGRTLRLNCRRILAGAQLGEFSLRPTQGSVHSIFVPLKRLQKDLAQQAQINAVLLARPATGNGLESISRLLKKSCTLQDLAIRFQTLASGKGFSLESNSIILDDCNRAGSDSDSGLDMGMESSPVYTYLANSIRARGREIPYSVITAADIGKGALRSLREIKGASSSAAPADPNDSIWLTEWAQRSLGISKGDPVEIDYFLWQQEGKLETRTARFHLAGILADSVDIDATLAPHIPGVTDAKSINAWDPPFPLDIERIRPADEEYWHRYKTTPKAFITLVTRARTLGEPIRETHRPAHCTARRQRPANSSEPIFSSPSPSAEPAVRRFHIKRRQRSRVGRIAGIYGFWRIFCLFQLLPDRRGHSACRFVF